MELDVYKTDGSKTGEKVALAPEIFEVEPNAHAIYQAVRLYRNNQRQGTAKVKTRSEVRGGGRKPYKQKHTGGARRGSQRSPLLVGGGSIFGPQPREYRATLPEKVKKLARKSALSSKAKEGSIKVVEDFTFESPKTKEMAAILKSLELSGKKTLMLMPKADVNVVKSGRNIQRCKVMVADKASTYDLVDTQVLLLQKSALDVLQNTFKN